MNSPMIGIGMIVFSVVLLIVSLYYIISSARNKERLLRLEKGMDPGPEQGQSFFLNAMKYGLGLMGAGIGFFTGSLVENAGFFSPRIELPLYFAPVMFFTGLGFVIFYKIYGDRYKG